MTCPRATSRGRTVRWGRSGLNRDGKKNKLQINYGLLTTRTGCPVALSVHEGHTADAKTLMPQVVKLRAELGLEQLVLVGDRGMISQKAIQELRELEGLAVDHCAQEQPDPLSVGGGSVAAGAVR